MLDIYLFRHAETRFNAEEDKVGGRSDFLDITDRGTKQAAALGRRLSREDFRFDKVYSSVAVRARRTAEIVCGEIGFPFGQVILRESLVELSQGDWEGGLRKDYFTPDLIATIERDPWNFKAPNGESQKDVEERVYGWAENELIPLADQDLTVGVFGHGLSTKCFLRRVLGSDPKITYRIGIDNCSITQLRYVPSGRHAGWSLIKVNDNAHLQECGFKPARWV